MFVMTNDLKVTNRN